MSDIRPQMSAHEPEDGYPVSTPIFNAIVAYGRSWLPDNLAKKGEEYDRLCALLHADRAATAQGRAGDGQ